MEIFAIFIVGPFVSMNVCEWMKKEIVFEMTKAPNCLLTQKSEMHSRGLEKSLGRPPGVTQRARPQNNKRASSFPVISTSIISHKRVGESAGVVPALRAGVGRRGGDARKREL